ncbi:type 2 isopentenyl-diphosphate Delta-isomerase, partial [Candidatus Bathyarchaeota archaeon]
MGRELERKGNPIRSRKADHIHICLNENVEAKNVTTGFEEIFFIHRALPELNLEKIDL